MIFQRHLSFSSAIQIHVYLIIASVVRYTDPDIREIWIVQEWGFGVELRWLFNESCYRISSVELQLTGDLEDSVYTNSNVTSARLEDLLPKRQYSVNAYVIYENGRKSDGARRVDFRTDTVPSKFKIQKCFPEEPFSMLPTVVN